MKKYLVELNTKFLTEEGTINRIAISLLVEARNGENLIDEISFRATDFFKGIRAGGAPQLFSLHSYEIARITEVETNA